MLICKRALYWGRVQGVGFRYTVHSLAEGFRVAGHVRNLPNGQVEVVAEGEADEVGGLLAAVAERMANFIKGHTVQDETPQGFTSFSIRA